MPMFYSSKHRDDVDIPSVQMHDGNGTSYIAMVTSSYLSELGCEGRWGSVNHLVFHLANSALLIAYLAPTETYGILFMHTSLVLGFLLFSTWAWVVLCAPDVFSWNFSFMLINAVQMMFILYRLRPLKFTPELDDVYAALFQPLKVPRQLFKKMVSPEYAAVLTLHKGEPYATQDVTKTDKLALLISGKAHVMCNGQFLHYIHEKQFFDSPEFESTTNGDEKFQVSIIASTTCRYIIWQRTALEYLFIKDHYLSNVMTLIVGRDITNKLYALNDKVRLTKGNYVDIRLPGVTATLGGADNQCGSQTGCDKKSEQRRHSWHDEKYDQEETDMYVDFQICDDVEELPSPHSDGCRLYNDNSNTEKISCFVRNGHAFQRPLVSACRSPVSHVVTCSTSPEERHV